MVGHESAEAEVWVVEVDPLRSEVLWAQEAYVAELAERFDGGFDPGDLAVELPRYRAPHGSCLLAWHGADVVGTAALTTIGPRDQDDEAAQPIGEVKRMWVAASMRGRGLGRELLVALEERAKELGFATLRLDTQASLSEARALYRAAGYREVERYNDNPYATHFFEKSLR